MSDFERAFAIVVGVESGFSDDPDDPGNWTGHAKGVGELKGTKYGISAASYPDIDIESLTLDGAHAIYKPDYWDKVQGDALPWPLSCVAFDCAVNQGEGIARVTLQQALGVACDGIIGPNTLAAAAHSTLFHVARFMTLRTHRYSQSLNFGKYGDGWFNRLFTVCLNAGGAQ